MTDDFDYDVFISNTEWNSKKKQISTLIYHFIEQSKERISKSFSPICKDNKFSISLIKDTFLYLKNCTNLFNNLTIIQIREIPPIIFRIGKEIFSPQWIIYNENQFLRKINNLYGFIYVAINQATKNKKVYVGQTIRTIEEEWGEIFSHGKTLRKKRNENPLQTISARYIHNAIAKYPDDVWDLKLIDIAYSQPELDYKETHYIVDVYDSMNPEKGYNLTTGGRTGGRLSPITKNKVSKSVSDVWNTPGYRERLINSHLKAWNSEERREKASKTQLKLWDNEERKKKQSQVQKKLWKNNEVREKRIEGMSKTAKESWEDPSEAMLRNLNNMHQKTRKEIKNIKEFLIDIKNTRAQKDFLRKFSKKYDIKTHMTLNRLISETLGNFEITTYKLAWYFLIDRDANEIFKYLDNPEGYSTFRDPSIREFFIDVLNSEFGSDLHQKYQVWHKQGLITKIKRIVGKFGIDNYTNLKDLLQMKGIDKGLEYFEKLDKFDRFDNRC